jgi:DNA-binding Lrp family transcriptional regulator
MDETPAILDRTSRKILVALDRDPRATVGWLAEHLALARGTVQSRISQLFTAGTLKPVSTTVRTESLGYDVRAIVTAEMEQSLFDEAIVALGEIPEVIECVATAGDTDLMCHVVARDAADLYRVGQLILRTPGIRRTATAIVLKELIPFRTSQLLARP